MFIDRVMTKIWEPVTKQYKEAYDEAMSFSAEQLYQKHLSHKMKFYPYIGLTMNYIDTIGCPYRARGGSFSGCSMCDFQSERVTTQARLLALRDKDPNLYAKAVLDAFLNARGDDATSSVIENLSGYDSLDLNEVPEELCEKLFGRDLFSDQPFITNVETRASTITRQRLEKFSKTVSGKKRISIDFGVEVGDEWLRNNWLNKNLTNEQIINATNDLHDYNFKAVGNIIFGVPGLTEEQSIQIFLDTVVWMDSIGIDKIVLHVLNRKKYTLQGFLYANLSNEPELLDLGLAQREHTGLPWIFTVIRAINELYIKHPKIMKKLAIVRIDEKYNSIKNDICYNNSLDCTCNKKYINILNELQFSRNFEALGQLINKMQQDPCYTHYQSLLNRQQKCGNYYKTIDIWSRHISKILQGDNWMELYSELEFAKEEALQE